jgi:hypothetical protein
MNTDIELLVHIVPVDTTTQDEVATLAEEVRSELETTSGVIKVSPVEGVTPQGSKTVGLAVVGAFILSVGPKAVDAVLKILKLVLGRPGQPRTIIKIQSKGTKYDFEFDPRVMKLEDIVDQVRRLEQPVPKN